MVSIGGVPVPMGLLAELLLIAIILLLYFVFYEFLVERVWRFLSGSVEEDLEITETEFSDSVHSGYRPSVLHTSGLFSFKNISRFDLQVKEVDAEIEWGETQVATVHWRREGFQSDLVDIESPKQKGEGWVRVNADLYPDPSFFEDPLYVSINGVAVFEGDSWLTSGRVTAQKELVMREKVRGKTWEEYLSDLGYDEGEDQEV